MPSSPTEPLVMVPREPTEAWVHSLANYWQGQSDTPRCEPPGGYALDRARKTIADVLKNAPLAASPSDVGTDGYQSAFYELAAIMDLDARPHSPAEVWRDEMLPRLKRAFSSDVGGTMIKAPLPAGVIDTPEVRARMQAAIEEPSDVGARPIAGEGREEGSFCVYSEPKVGLPPSLFEGSAEQSGFAPVNLDDARMLERIASALNAAGDRRDHWGGMEPRLISAEMDADCGCPEEYWEAYGLTLHMHLRDGESNAHADGGDWGEAEISVRADTIERCRSAIFGWAKGLMAPTLLTPKTEPTIPAGKEPEGFRDPCLNGVQGLPRCGECAACRPAAPNSFDPSKRGFQPR